jgi:hypothetical protein
MVMDKLEIQKRIDSLLADRNNQDVMGQYRTDKAIVILQLKLKGLYKLGR